MLNIDLVEKKTVKERIILGIDPGTSIMGYGLILEKGSNVSLITLGIIDLSKYDEHAIKLKKIFERTLQIVDEYKPDCLAIEAPFYGKNIQVMLKLGRAQGVAMAAGLYRQVPIFEYSPKKVKQSITGNGNASKEQVAAMLMQLLKFKEVPEFLDATDGVALAVCHSMQKISTTENENFTGWKSFLKANPKRAL